MNISRVEDAPTSDSIFVELNVGLGLIYKILYPIFLNIPPGPNNIEKNDQARFVQVH